jgi:hypothetical protein
LQNIRAREGLTAIGSSHGAASVRVGKGPLRRAPELIKDYAERYGGLAEFIIGRAFARSVGFSPP